MSTHVTVTYLNHMIGTATVSAIATGSALTTHIKAASALVDTALVNAGYSIPSSANDTIKLATLEMLVQTLHGLRKGISLPADLTKKFDGLTAGIASGKIQVPNMTPDAQDAVGGVKFADQTADNGIPSVFQGTDLSKYF